jgi:rRNA maturation endonuclease Nob1
MIQKTTSKSEALTEAISPLATCKGCGRRVPRTNLCLYCGKPILFRKPVKA